MPSVISHSFLGERAEVGVGYGGAAPSLWAQAGDSDSDTVNVQAPEAIVARILAAADQLQTLPAGADIDAVRGVFPEAAQAIETAGLEVARLLVGEGMWDREAAPESERDFALVVRGPRAAIEWLAATLGTHSRAGDATSQEEVLVAYLGQPDGTPAATFLIASAGPEPIRAFRRAARSLRGWHVAYTTNGQLAEIFVLRRDTDPAEFAALRLEAVAVVSLGREDYDAAIARGATHR